MLSQKNIEKLVKGGIYRASDIANSYSQRYDGWDQRYSYWVPIRVPEHKNWKDEIVPDEWYMINTYQIERKGLGNFEDCIEYLEHIFEKGKYALSNTNNYYYSANIKLSDSLFNEFTFIADLHDYEVESYDRKARDFSEEDVLENVKLYFEHKYPTGINLIKKGAKPSVKNEIYNIAAKLWSISSPSCYISNEDVLTLKKKITFAKEYNIEFDEKYAQRALDYYEDIQKTIEFWKSLREARRE